MTRIIPGVQVSVVKEVIPPQLAPSGVLGLVGITEQPSNGTIRASSWKRFVDVCGPGSAYSIPEARQALENGVFELVVSPVDPSSAKTASVVLKTSAGTDSAVGLSARAPGIWANDLSVEVVQRVKTTPGGESVVQGFDLGIDRPGGDKELYRNLSVVPGSSRYVNSVLERRSSLVLAAGHEIPEYESETVNAGGSLALVQTAAGNVVLALHTMVALQVNVTFTQQAGYAVKVLDPANQESPVLFEYAGPVFPGQQLVDHFNDHFNGDSRVSLTAAGWPGTGSALLADGEDAGPGAYMDALARLANEPDVDLVLAALQDMGNSEDVTRVYGAIISHCDSLSDEAKGRIGFGHVPPAGTADERAAHAELASALVSDRFALFAPHGVAGAAAGMVGNLSYFHSPTFKPVAGLETMSANLGVEEQRQYLRSNIVPVVRERGRGTIVVRGLTTDGDQINVRRTADRAVRGVKAIGELFIGRLNNATGRAALRQKLIEFLLQMQKDGAIVPSTDGSDPAFKVDVYSSQADFAQGIVRVDIAVRPVRAIDFIYATVLVQV